jgi:hypothetical protein
MGQRRLHRRGSTIAAAGSVAALTTTVALALALVVGCEKENTEATIVPEAGTTTIDSSSSTNNDGSDVIKPDDGGVIGLDGGDAGPRACSTDPDCKGGQCFLGVCICDVFLRVQPDGTCGSAVEPPCLDQIDAGSRCNSPQPVCREEDAGEISGSSEANRSCGDFAPAVCCFTGCRGPTFYCCNPSGSAPQICTQGWRTCRPNERATLDASSCN